MSPPTKKSTRKTTKSPATAERFIYKEDGTVFICERCRKLDPKNIKPLDHPPVFIPIASAPEPFILKTADPKKPSVKAMKQKLNWMQVCLPCAKYLISALRKEDLLP